MPKTDKKTSELQMQRDLFCDYLEQEGELSNEVIESLRKSNALTVLERLGNVFNKSKVATTMDNVRDNVDKVLENSGMEDVEKVRESLLNKYRIFVKKMNVIEDREEKSEDEKVVDDSIMHKAYNNYINKRFEKKGWPLDKKKAERFILNISSKAEVKLLSEMFGPYVLYNLFFKNIDKIKDEDWMTVDLLKKACKTKLGSQTFVENLNDYKEEDWVGEVMKEAVKNYPGAYTLIKNIDDYKGMDWFNEIMMIIAGNSEFKFFKLISDLENTDWMTEEIALIGVNDERNAYHFFCFAEKYKDAAWVTESVANAAAIGKNSGDAFFENVGKYKDANWITEKVARMAGRSAGNLNAIFKNMEDYRDAKWMTERLAMEGVSNYYGAREFLSGFEKYYDVRWMTDEIIIRAIDLVNTRIDKIEFYDFFKNMHKLKGFSWVTEELIKKIIGMNGMLDNESFYKNIADYKDEEWMTEGVLKMLFDNDYDLFFKNLNALKQMPGFFEMVLYVLGIGYVATTLFKYLDTYEDEDLITEEMILKALRLDCGGAIFEKMEVLENKSWLTKKVLFEVLYRAKSYFFKNMKNYKNAEWITPELLQEAIFDNIRGIQLFYQYFDDFKDAIWMNDDLKNPVAVYLMREDFLQGDAEAALKIKHKLGIKSQILTDVIKEVLKDKGPQVILPVLNELPENVLKSLEDEWFLLTYKNDLGFPSLKIYQDYVKLMQGGDEMQRVAFVNAIRDDIEFMISSERQSDDLKQSEYYEEIVKISFPNHSSNWTNMKNNESCDDRSQDLNKFKINPAYEIDLSEGVEMELKKGVEEDKSGIHDLQKPIERMQRKFLNVGFEQDKMKSILDDELDVMMEGIEHKEIFKTREEKIYALVLESMIGNLEVEKLKDILIGYQFVEFQDVREYLRGTRGRAEKAKNPKYAYLLELREFFADHLKDVQRKIASDAHNNREILDLLPKYIGKKRAHESAIANKDLINRLRPDQIGWDAGLFERIAKILDKKTKGKWRKEEINRKDVKEVKMESNVFRTMMGMIWGEQKNAARIVKALTGEEVDPKDIDLGEFNFEQYIRIRQMDEETEFDEDLFEKYLMYTFQQIFNEELELIDREISKYRVKSEEKGKKRSVQNRKLECFITKNHTSAHARGVGGVCVAGDNPSKAESERRGENKCQWNMPEYFQMVLRDKENKICQGLVILHYYEEDGKKVLTASMNPSSTYLYKVNETQLFEGLIGQLGIFAKDNDVDMIVLSKNAGIRTNRTGGEFERAMNDQIRKIDREFEFDEQKIFSFSPSYTVKKCDVVWVKPE